MNKIGPLPRFNVIGRQEAIAVYEHIQDGNLLSGFLGGEIRGGNVVQRLEDEWCETFGSTHAIAVNSATSGLLAACHAIGVTNEEVIVSPYTMSATAAAPAFLGADLKFVDVEPEHYCLDPKQCAPWFREERSQNWPKAIITTNLFGHPAQLKLLAQLAHANGAYLIEDNAQAPFATENGSYAGTIGDIGVFSLNVHKHIQCGEGGVVVTDNDDFAHAMRMFINHGEMAGHALGLNLRMTEVTAAIACAQLARGKEIVQSRIDLAERLIEGLKDNPLIKINPPRAGCKHVYYTLPMEVNRDVINRANLLHALAGMGVPLEHSYVAPLYWLPAFKEWAPERPCAITEKLYKESLVYFEICGYDPTPDQVKLIIESFNRVADDADRWTQGRA